MPKSPVNCLVLAACFCLLAQAGCSKTGPDVKNSALPAGEAPEASVVKRDPSVLSSKGPAEPRTVAQLFADIDEDKNQIIEDEELRMANIYCGSWFPADRAFVETLWERRAEFGHIYEPKSVAPLGEARPPVNKDVKRIAFTVPEFENAWHVLRPVQKNPDNQTR